MLPAWDFGDVALQTPSTSWKRDIVTIFTNVIVSVSFVENSSSLTFLDIPWHHSNHSNIHKVMEANGLTCGAWSCWDTQTVCLCGFCQRPGKHGWKILVISKSKVVPKSFLHPKRQEEFLLAWIVHKSQTWKSIDSIDGLVPFLSRMSLAQCSPVQGHSLDLFLTRPLDYCVDAGFSAAEISGLEPWIGRNKDK